MNIDNTSASVVIDPKSQASIDAVRDRITLLDAENARLTKLKAVLDDSIRKAEADFAYKTSLLEEIDKQIIEATDTLNKVIATEVEASNAVHELQSTEAQIKKDLDEQAVALSERERSLNAREFSVGTRTEILIESEEELKSESLLVQSKKEAIAELLTKL